MKFIPQGLSRTIGRQILQTKHQSPHLFFAAGVIGVAASTVLACRATLKLSETLDEFKDDIESVKAMQKTEGQQEIFRDHYTKSEYHRDLAYVYVKGVGNLGRLYGPSIVVGGLSIAALTGSHIQLSRRNTALTAAYAGLQKAYNEYRDRVREELGEERELDIYHAAVTEKVKGDDGKVKTVKVVDPNKMSPYARFFDEYSPEWQKDPELNRLYVQVQQNYANHLLHARGYVFLNEVYDMLGLEQCHAGQVVGWVIGEEGDNYIDFGMYEARNRDFVNGQEQSILLDFNVDGVVIDKIFPPDGKRRR